MGPLRTVEDIHPLLKMSFPPFSPHNALSSDRGVLGPALFAVMDGPRRSTVATVIG